MDSYSVLMSGSVRVFSFTDSLLIEVGRSYSLNLDTYTIFVHRSKFVKDRLTSSLREVSHNLGLDLSGMH